MNIINIKKHRIYLEEYCRLCSLEWGKPKTEKEMNQYIQEKVQNILKGDKVINVLKLKSGENLYYIDCDDKK